MSEEFGPRNSLLSRDGILWHMAKGNIIIDPYNPDKLKTVSYDLALGSCYYASFPESESNGFIYNPWDEKSVREFWGEPRHAKTAGELFNDSQIPNGIRAEDKVIILKPNELVLCHTGEFIGGKFRTTGMMKARSSMGRSGISVCKCAGWGDVGYTNRWTMEIQNGLPILNILIVGESVAQLVFFQVDPVDKDDYVSESGKYQTETDLEKIKKNWKPEDMLPKLWKDREK
ncbi:hypothetical protein A2210_01240 [Candidatus Woesebacteria bacterium RIFOXYA1_FULL_40_18]|uniref:Deoxycytidine triphosphate deaminase n=4 Tax=Candidatus Woeseibacteriota TaxID=1752722 RepID=A0A1F8CMZ8_9BACT|nr:MAG: hypothetical protein A2210_01240 [Candidatus Woesebacteria bacterium RIFOXYA1_FULL_40_18]OGM80806.1 MAG: hypothetical protein A2361_00635 [Candidatus Woesebacteria bacterium RIFOXYB1_FULL_40_26]OGM87671.1 MAG: hypothetical protein A2614_01375 [Candidatus Woesebacteria bacterium RIFOXYD1_FULL_40_21]